MTVFDSGAVVNVTALCIGSAAVSEYGCGAGGENGADQECGKLLHIDPSENGAIIPGQALRLSAPDCMIR